MHACVCSRVCVRVCTAVDEISLGKAPGNIPTDVICIGIKQMHLSCIWFCWHHFHVSECFLTLCTAGPVLGPGIVSGDCCWNTKQRHHQSQHTHTHTNDTHRVNTLNKHDWNGRDQFYHSQSITHVLLKPTFQLILCFHVHLLRQ